MITTRSQGFTLVELILIIVILGIISFIALPRLGSLGAYDVRLASQDLIEAIRYAQAQSMTKTGANQFQIAISNTGYRVTQAGVDITHPISGAASYTEDASEWSDVNVSASGTISFDGRGKPTCTSYSACTTPSDTNVTLTISKGADSAGVTIERYTGYARLN